MAFVVNGGDRDFGEPLRRNVHAQTDWSRKTAALEHLANGFTVGRQGLQTDLRGLTGGGKLHSRFPSQMDAKDPILFLDIDGVLNTTRSCSAPGGREHFSSEAVIALKQILELSGTHIVISSSWREDHARLRIVPTFVKNGLEAFVHRIHGATPIIPDAPESTRRADEIGAWLAGAQMFDGPWLVIDDDVAVREFRGRHILTDHDKGLTIAHVSEAIKILKRPRGNGDAASSTASRTSKSKPTRGGTPRGS